MGAKERRHAKILDLIKIYQIETQDELTTRLNAEGYEATQATVSRDIKSLQLVKVLIDGKRYMYALPSAQSSPQRNQSKYYSIMKDSIVSVAQAQNLVVVKCYSGMAQGACAALDALENTGIVGTIAGDDTIFVAAATNHDAKQIVDQLNGIIS